jgi:type VI secretion system protein ImpG
VTQFNQYYQDELQFLRQVGPEFARVNPEIARSLGDPGSDPDVERILEGVAFLCGRIRQKLDDELPEFTENLMGLLWPHFLRPIPSMTILEFLPDIETMQAPVAVNAGSEFLSVPVDGTRCRYRACYRTKLRPWKLRNIRLETASAEPVRLVLRLQTSRQASLEDLDLGSVQLFLAGEARAAFALYLLLTAHVDHVEVSDGSDRHHRPTMRLNPESITPAGLTREQAVLPYPDRSFAGYRLLQEYFAMKERFLFVDVQGLDRAVDKLELTNTLEVAVTFNRRLEDLPQVSTESVRLHCVPIINLFEHPGEPIRIRQDRTEYFIEPSKTGIADRRHLEIYSVDRVFGLVRAEELEAREYAPFYAFQHATRTDPTEAIYYQAHLKPNVVGVGPRKRQVGTSTYLSFVSGRNSRALPSEESISVELTCATRHLPVELGAGDIREPTDTSPPSTSFRNLYKPTSTVTPPLGKSLHWRLISHMSLNYVSLTHAARLKELLRVYDFQSEYDAQRALEQQRLLDGIERVQSTFAERMIRGAPIRGMQIEVELNEDHFAGEGDAYLFATILDRFFGLYVTLNAYTQLTVRFTKSGRVYPFEARWGEQATPVERRPADAYA